MQSPPGQYGGVFPLAFPSHVKEASIEKCMGGKLRQQGEGETTKDNSDPG